MADLNISSFVSSKVKEFLSQFDTDNSGIIEKSNGEYAALTKALNGGKAEELGNVDYVSFGNTQAARANTPSNVDWDVAVNNFNNLRLPQREQLASLAKEAAGAQYDKMTTKVDVALMNAGATSIQVEIEPLYEALTSAASRSNNVNALSPDDIIENALSNMVRGIAQSYNEKYETCRESIQDAIRQYDARYATDPGIVGVTYIRTEDTDVITSPTIMNLEDTVSNEDIMNFLSEISNYITQNNIEEFTTGQLEELLKLFITAKIEEAYDEQLKKLSNAAHNIEGEIANNRETTNADIDSVTALGNLYHSRKEMFDLTGPRMEDVFNVSDADPESYRTFISIIGGYYTLGVDAPTTAADSNKKYMGKDSHLHIGRDGQEVNEGGRRVR